MNKYEFTERINIMVSPQDKEYLKEKARAEKSTLSYYLSSQRAIGKYFAKNMMNQSSHHNLFISNTSKK